VLVDIWQSKNVPMEGDITMNEQLTMSKRELTRLEEIGQLNHKHFVNEDTAWMLGFIWDHLIEFL
jgi:hypothetical protein